MPFAKTQDLIDTLTKVNTSLDALNEKVSTLVTSFDEQKQKNIEQEVEQKAEQEKQKEFLQSLDSSRNPQTERAEDIKTIEQLFPVPPEYYGLVHTALNKNFQLVVSPISDSPAFQLSIIVPEKYSDVSEEYRRMYGHDVRLKVIPYSEGPQGVRAWAEKVFSSFNPTIQAMIVGDRQ